MAKSCARCGADEAYVNFQGPTYAETDDRSTLYGAISTGERRIHLHRPRGRCDGRDELQQDDAPLAWQHEDKTRGDSVPSCWELEKG